MMIFPLEIPNIVLYNELKLKKGVVNSMTDYLITAKVEVLYEKANDILTKYEEYFNSCNEPLECIELIYKNFCKYTKKIILCSNENEYKKLERNVNEYDKIIQNIYTASKIGA